MASRSPVTDRSNRISAVAQARLNQAVKRWRCKANPTTGSQDTQTLPQAMQTLGKGHVLDHVFREDGIEESVGKRERLASVEIDDFVFPFVVDDVGVEPTVVDVAPRPQLQPANGVGTQVCVDALAASCATREEARILERVTSRKPSLSCVADDANERGDPLELILDRHDL